MPYVYLIQPTILLNTSRYKIGMSRVNNISRMSSYKVGTRYLMICDCDDALALERKLRSVFKDKYKCIGGNEYFESNDELEMISLFVNTVMVHKKMVSTIEEDVNIVSSAPQQKNSLPSEWMRKYRLNPKTY